MTETDSTDALLVIRCQLGESHAWEELVERWNPRLSRFLGRLVATETTRDDLLQTVWLRVVRSLVRLREPERFAPWIFGIARAAVADRYRKQYRTPPQEEFTELPTSDDRLEDFVRTDSLAAALPRLHEIDREAVVLFYLEELPLTDVAAICGVPPGTIKSRLHRARRLLRHYLTD